MSTFWDDYKITVRDDSSYKRRVYKKLKRRFKKNTRVLVDYRIEILGNTFEYPFLFITSSGIIPLFIYHTGECSEITEDSRSALWYEIEGNKKRIVPSPIPKVKRAHLALEKYATFLLKDLECEVSLFEPILLLDRDIPFFKSKDSSVIITSLDRMKWCLKGKTRSGMVEIVYQRLRNF